MEGLLERLERGDRLVGDGGWGTMLMRRGLPAGHAPEWMALEVNSERCNGCGLCFRIACPAIVASDEIDPKSGRALAWIDPLLCTGCEICAQVCARGAILSREQVVEKERAAQGV